MTPTGISLRIFLRSELCDYRHAEQARDYWLGSSAQDNYVQLAGRERFIGSDG
jgi:hypothetical protein